MENENNIVEIFDEDEEVKNKKRSSPRRYSFEVISYWCDLDGWIDCLNSFYDLSKYLCILHDKDLEIREGLHTFKKPHIHTYLTVKRPYSFKNLAQSLSFLSPLDNENKPLFTVTPQNIGKIKRSLFDSYIYALHRDEKSFSDELKYKYDRNDLRSNDFKFFIKSKSSEEKGAAIIIDLLSGVSLFDMMSKYGRDFIIHYNQYKEFADNIRYEREMKYNEFEKDLVPAPDTRLVVEEDDDDPFGLG